MSYSSSAPSSEYSSAKGVKSPLSPRAAYRVALLNGRAFGLGGFDGVEVVGTGKDKFGGAVIEDELDFILLKAPVDRQDNSPDFGCGAVQYDKFVAVMRHHAQTVAFDNPGFDEPGSHLVAFFFVLFVGQPHVVEDDGLPIGIVLRHCGRCSRKR